MTVNDKENIKKNIAEAIKVNSEVEKIILWDFEGTLVDRPGRWRSALIEVLDLNEPGHQVDYDQIRPYLKDGLPWHRPDEIHTECNESSSWWASLKPLSRCLSSGKQQADVMCDSQSRTLIWASLFLFARKTAP